MKDRDVTLSGMGQWLLYRAMVCESFDKNPHVKELIEVDPWEFSSALDMSFEETAKLPLDEWHLKIASDMQEMLDYLDLVDSSK